MRFIKLSNLFINASKIVSIEKTSDKYKIIMCHQEVSSWFIAGSGYISSELCEYDIHKKSDSEDYKRIEQFIDTYDDGMSTNKKYSDSHSHSHLENSKR